MAWLSLTTNTLGLFDPQGLSGGADIAPDGFLHRGTLLIETRLSPHQKPQHLLQFERGGNDPVRLSLQAIPGGGVIFVLDHAGDVVHQVINATDAGRMDTLRLSYSWDVPTGLAQLAVERPEKETTILRPLSVSKPFRTEDVSIMAQNHGDCFVSPDLVYFAVSDAIEPVGPMPTLAAHSPIATPDGYKPVRNLKRGDLVITGDGQAVPVLYSVSRTVPACGSFAPVQVRAPFFGLQQNIITAPNQRLVISGSEVEYMFGHEAVLVPAQHLAAGHAAVAAASPTGFVTYCQVILPGHQEIDVAGAALESMFIGRLRRKPELLRSSLLARYHRNALPEHATSVYPVLRAFDAVALAEERIA